MALNYGHRITIKKNGIVAPIYPYNNQWQRQESSGSTWTNIGAYNQSTYTVANEDRGASIRLQQIFTNGDLLYSNTLVVTNTAPADPWENASGIYHIIKPDNTGFVKLDGHAKAYYANTAVFSGNEITEPGEYYVTGPNTRFGDSTADWEFGPDTDTRRVTNMARLLVSSSNFNGSLAEIDTSNVTNMSYMLAGTKAFDQPLDHFNTRKVKDMGGMFSSTGVFNQNLNTWNVSNLESVSRMFSSSQAFNGNIDGWDLSGVKNFMYMFQQAQAFNSSINNWNTSRMELTDGMFDNAVSFNKPLNNWNTSNLTTASNMFRFAKAFWQDLSHWCTPEIQWATRWDSSSGFFNQYFYIVDWNDGCDLVADPVGFKRIGPHRNEGPYDTCIVYWPEKQAWYYPTSTTIARSLDKGVSWHDTNWPSPSKKIPHRIKLINGELWGIHHNVLAKCSNGMDWELVPNQPLHLGIDFDRSNSGKWFIAGGASYTTNNQVAWSVDDGATWNVEKNDRYLGATENGFYAIHFSEYHQRWFGITAHQRVFSSADSNPNSSWSQAYDPGLGTDYSNIRVSESPSGVILFTPYNPSDNHGGKSIVHRMKSNRTWDLAHNWNDVGFYLRAPSWVEDRWYMWSARDFDAGVDRFTLYQSTNDGSSWTKVITHTVELPTTAIFPNITHGDGVWMTGNNKGASNPNKSKQTYMWTWEV
jgi:hypothetical protein